MSSCNRDEEFSSFLWDQLKSLHERVVHHQQALVGTPSEPKIASFALQPLKTHSNHSSFSSLPPLKTDSNNSPLASQRSDGIPVKSDAYAVAPVNSFANLERGTSVPQVLPLRNPDGDMPVAGDVSLRDENSLANNTAVRRKRRASTVTGFLSSIVSRKSGCKADSAVDRGQPNIDETEKGNGTLDAEKKTKFDPVFLPCPSTEHQPLGYFNEEAQHGHEPSTPKTPGLLSSVESRSSGKDQEQPSTPSTGGALVLDANSKVGEMAAAQWRRLKSRSSTRCGTRKNTIGKSMFNLELHTEWAPDTEVEKENETRVKMFKSTQELPRLQINKRDGLRDSVAHTIRQESIIDKESETAKKVTKRISLHSVEEIQTLRSRLFAEQNVRLMTRFCLLFITEPTTRTRIFWDFCGLFLLGYDIIIIPLQVFDLGTTPFLTVMQWIVLLYWSADIVASFFVGYHREGIVEIRPMRIAKRYIKTWFFVDLTLVLVDVAIMITGESDGGDPTGVARFGKSFRALRILRAIRLVRLAKLPKILEQIQEQVQSEYLIVMISITKLTTFLLASNHFIACSWYFLGDSIDNNTWIQEYDIANKPGAYRYTTSLHWSLTQFTPASMEVFPQNLAERIFCVIVLVFAMVTFSSFVSSITNAMTSLRNMNVDASKQQALLQKYLRLNKINLSLSVRIRRHIEFVMSERQCQLREDDVPLLAHLMEPLRIELHYEVYAHALKVHPFFHTMDVISSRVMERLCHKSVGEKYTLPGDRIFTFADAAEHMYISINDGLRYQLHESPSQDNQGTIHCIHQDQWLCEIVLWSTWVHKGDCWGEAYCHTVLVHSGNFRDAVKGASYPRSIMSRYAVLYVDHAKRFLDTITDLHPLDFNMERAICVALYEDVESDSDSETSSQFPSHSETPNEKDVPGSSWASRRRTKPQRPHKDASKYGSAPPMIQGWTS